MPRTITGSKARLVPGSNANNLFIVPMKNTATNLIWRFYMDHNHRWKWQQLSVHREVIAESHAAYKDYEECLSDARGKGYDFQPSQARLVPGQRR